VLFLMETFYLPLLMYASDALNRKQQLTQLNTCWNKAYRNAGDTRTRNLHVCHSDLQQDFSCASFLYEIEHVLFDVLVQETCIKNLMQVSCTSFLHVCHKHKAFRVADWESIKVLQALCGRMDLVCM